MKKNSILFIVSFLSFLGCSTKEEYSSSPKENYKALWTVLDEGYCYFKEKLPKDSTWYDMYEKYLPKIQNDMPSDSLFDVMAQLLAELKDGHVNLVSPFDISHYDNWEKDYPQNCNNAIRKLYLGDKYRIAGGLYYGAIQYNNHQKDSIGYIQYPSFMSSTSVMNIVSIFVQLRHCKGLILDIRNNKGGLVSNAHLLASHFAAQKTLTGYMRHKIGKGHNDFSEPRPIYVDTLKNGVRWYRPVVVLTNRACYSAANDFALIMKEMPYVTVLGDFTGGGGGVPRSSELPNGWAVRYSSSIMTDIKDQTIEFGVAPDIKVDQNEEDTKNKKDTLIERAIGYINSIYRKK